MFEPAPPAAFFPDLADTEAAVAVAEGEAETAIEEGERVALGFLESGCEYLKGEDLLAEPRPEEAVAKKRFRAVEDAMFAMLVVTVTLPRPSDDGINVLILIMSWFRWSLRR